MHFALEAENHWSRVLNQEQQYHLGNCYKFKGFGTGETTQCVKFYETMGT